MRHYVFRLNLIQHERRWMRSMMWSQLISEGWRLLVDTFFQNGQILVDIFWGWILVDTFGDFLWTFFVHENSSPWVNFVDIFWVNSKVPILLVVISFRMKLWRVAHFFSLTFGEVCNLKREEAKLLLLFSNHKPHQKWVKKNGQLVRVSFGKNLLLTELVL